MSEYLGSRISLISKSDIRYVGVLHEINSEQSTVSLENVRSFGTEGRRVRPEDEIAPSDQVYEYIVFRGSDVKDLRIEQQAPVKENKPPAVPDDPAILGVGTRPDLQGPGPQAPAPVGQNYNNAYGQQGDSWGRGGPGPVPGHGPGPGPAFGGMPYPPHPGWFPPGQGFPPGAPPPPGPGPWNNYPFPPAPPGVGGPAAGIGQDPMPKSRTTPNPVSAPEPKRTPLGPEKQSQSPAQPVKPQSTQLNEPRHMAQPARQSQHAPTPPVDSKPSLEEVKAASGSYNPNGQPSSAQPLNKAVPTGPKTNRAAVPIPPAVPRPFQVQAAVKATSQPGAKTSAAVTQATVRDATQAARAAVAVAMAQLNSSATNTHQAEGPSVDNLTQKVNEMRVNASRSGQANRGRGRGGRGGLAKVEVPDADFDFASSNAKFNKEDVIKEAIAGSPLTETPNGSAAEILETATPTEDPPKAYNKSRSFFDNISSEARERAESGGQKQGGRERRGEEQRKNIETFGQGSVDGGYRGGYRGRGRGRGGMRGRGYGRGGQGGYRSRDGPPATMASQ